MATAARRSGRTRAAAGIVAGIAFLARAGDRRGARTLGKTEEPYWKRVFSGFDKSKEWLAKEKPDVCI
jgi:protocatechuate 4,5-dioxygenase beta chain